MCLLKERQLVTVLSQQIFSIQPLGKFCQYVLHKFIINLFSLSTSRGREWNARKSRPNPDAQPIPFPRLSLRHPRIPHPANWFRRWRRSTRSWATRLDRKYSNFPFLPRDISKYKWYVQLMQNHHIDASGLNPTPLIIKKLNLRNSRGQTKCV